MLYTPLNIQRFKSFLGHIIIHWDDVGYESSRPSEFPEISMTVLGETYYINEDSVNMPSSGYTWDAEMAFASFSENEDDWNIPAPDGYELTDFSLIASPGGGYAMETDITLTYVPEVGVIDLTVTIAWDDVGHESERPKDISLNYLNNAGGQIGSVYLSSENNSTDEYTWKSSTNISEDFDTWDITVPDNYEIESLEQSREDIEATLKITFKYIEQGELKGYGVFINPTFENFTADDVNNDITLRLYSANGILVKDFESWTTSEYENCFEEPLEDGHTWKVAVSGEELDNDNYELKTFKEEFSTGDEEGWYTIEFTVIQNTITSVQYRYCRIDTGEWTDLTDIPYTLNEEKGTFTCTNVILDLDNQYEWTIEVYVNDVLTQTMKTLSLDRGSAIFMICTNEDCVYINNVKVGLEVVDEW